MVVMIHPRTVVWSGKHKQEILWPDHLILVLVLGCYCSQAEAPAEIAYWCSLVFSCIFSFMSDLHPGCHSWGHPYL